MNIKQFLFKLKKCESLNKMDIEFKITHSLKREFKEKWDDKISDFNPFLKSSFLKLFELYDSKELKPFYIMFKNNFIYGNLITITGKKAANYYDQNNTISFKKWMMKRVKIRVFCFGNTHMSNMPCHQLEGNFLSEEKFKYLTSFINQKYGIKYFLIPDHFFSVIIAKKKKLSNQFNIFKIDPDMRLDIPQNWNSFEDYNNAISSKYKKRLRGELKKSEALNSKIIYKEDLINLKEKMSLLYNNVYLKSSFSGPPFDIDIFKELLKLDFLRPQIKGYYLENKLVAFSSCFQNQNKLYSYYIGLNYQLNKKHSIYSKILYDTIEKGIKQNVSQIVFGRTASEFKSTIGAYPNESTSAMFISNPIINIILKSVFKRVYPEQWIQRRPFKSK